MNSITKICRKCREIKYVSSFISPRARVCIDCTPRKTMRPACIYLISGAGLVKIGIAIDVSKRLASLNIGSPVDLSVTYWFWSEDCQFDENYLHKIFKDKRIKGEWFDLSEQDIEWIKVNYPSNHEKRIKFLRRLKG